MTVVARSQSARWQGLALAAALLLAMGWCFAYTFAEMWSRWFPVWASDQLSFYGRIVGGESYYTHGPLVPGVSLLIAWLLIRHTRIDIKPRRLAGVVVLAICLALHLLACRARVNFVSGFAMIGSLAGLVLAGWGWHALGRLWFPLAFLLFMVPLPEVTIANLNFELKMLASRLGVGTANFLGVLAERNGNRVVLEGGKSLVIANVCNGLRTLISLLAFGALYSYICRLRGFWRLALFAMTVPVAVASNALRIVGLIIVADLVSVPAATGWFHDLSGLLIFALAFAMMFGIERVIRWARRLVGRPSSPDALFEHARLEPDNSDQWQRMLSPQSPKTSYAALALAVLAAVGSYFLTGSAASTWTQTTAANALPEELTVGDRQLYGYHQVLDRRTLGILETEDYFFCKYVGADVAPTDFCIIYSQDNRKGTHPPDLCVAGSGDGIVARGEVVIPDVQGRGDLSCRELVVQSGDKQTYFLYTYKCGDGYTSSFWAQQWTILLNGLTRRDSSGALIRISTPAEASVAQARQWSIQFMRQAIPFLDKNLQVKGR